MVTALQEGSPVVWSGVGGGGYLFHKGTVIREGAEQIS